MSFSGGNDYNRGINNLGGISQQATNQLFPAAFNAGNREIGAGGKEYNAGMGTAASGINYFNTLMGGNRANTTAQLQPDINRIRDANQSTLQAVSTLMPRGGGRSGALFNLPFQQNQQIQGMYGGQRAGAAGALADLGMQRSGLGLQRVGLGGNLFGIGNSALGTASNASRDIADMGLRQKMYSDQKAAGIASGLMGLAMTPFGGGTGLFGMMNRGK